MYRPPKGHRRYFYSDLKNRLTRVTRLKSIVLNNRLKSLLLFHGALLLKITAHGVKQNLRHQNQAFHIPYMHEQISTPTLFWQWLIGISDEIEWLLDLFTSLQLAIPQMRTPNMYGKRKKEQKAAKSKLMDAFLDLDSRPNKHAGC